MNPVFEQKLLASTNAQSIERIEVIQTLWSGYGTISRYCLDNDPSKTVIVKHIAPQSSGEHPRGWNSQIGHTRKIKSYKVETRWYENWSKYTSNACRIPEYIGSFTDGMDQFIILEDLNTDYPDRRQTLTLNEVKVCLKWLANFHMAFMGKQPKDLWHVGTYWHLGTRPEEYTKIQHPELKSKAYAIDELLNTCVYQTLVHGDAKLANFCFSSDGREVAAVDFQYVGGGCGIKDVAYFMGSCLSSSECEHYEDELLTYYFAELRDSCNKQKLSIDMNELELEWGRLFPVAWTDFTRFLLGWMPSHQKVNNYSLRLMNSVLSSL